ncbi:MAG: LysR family transcriptional regulator [Microcoleus sp. PH2017_01_SCD_O_A]|nr:LysR family transcriptional regulator [Microcoleus sp. PH2017_02_FOX_O_A]MCC3417856.1 LysR family transcriptional regulator [Microcoleus sp. PH2017_07_MST_O_A]MCC3426583.1 LysR family transcriptional regulator [Microcoleus sp. PH2017_01_SCD_O_A]MCC3449696.1 LysR family transcriptional regulator [Microcoleus sp. PH2017_09_SFU_O_A]MCC3454236.1 LysR family transcriptional regulator [Microcoleus sp. PH2017_08_TRC_O_A]MCC3474060.1 LysR family transcriptional regulator [Microcoleus sp. PH2017_13_
MDRIACMQTFVRAIEMKSFSAVAREQQTTQPTISKQIAALEKYLGVQLITRSTTNLSLTEEGKRYYQYCQQILETVAEAEASLTGKERATGILRLGCPVLFGEKQIVPRLKAFMKRYPDVKIDLMMADSFVDIVENGLDLLIRIGNRPDSSLISHRIGTTRRVTVATTGYFEQAGEPQTPDDLVDRDCIVYTHLSTGNEWHFQGTDGTIKVQVGGCFQTNSSVAIRAAVLSGLGIAVAPVWMFGDEIYRGDLKVVLEDYQPTPLPINGVYRRSRFYPAKITCFIDFLEAEFKLDPWV